MKQVGAKRPYLYVLVAEGLRRDETSYPLSHVLAESHTVPTLAHFLAQLARDYKTVTKSPFVPPRVVMDLSWALIHAVAEGVCKTKLLSYLEECWKATKGSQAPKTIISLCGNHILHQFSRALAENGVKKESRARYMWLFAKLQTATCLQQMDEVFKKMCVLALSKKQPKNLVDDLDALAAARESEVKDEPEAPPEASQASQTYRTKTSFGRHFDALMVAVKADIPDDELTNGFYAPSLVDYMVRNLMSLAPLWSQLLSGSVTSNAAVEAYMGVVKRQMLRGRRRFHPCEFVRKLMNDTVSRVKLDAVQETHSRPDLELVWKSEWGGQIFFSHGGESVQAGVMILLPHGFQQTVSDVRGDEDGRLLSLILDYGAEKLLLIGVYAPSLDNQSTKCFFLDKFREILLDYGHHKTIAIGDFNIKLGPLDTHSINHKSTRAANKLRDILDEFFMEDAWRYQHTAIRKYTWRRTNPLQQSRIDYVFISNVFLNTNEVKTKIESGILSDHNFVLAEIRFCVEKRGPGIWRFNNELLEDFKFINSTRSEILKAVNGTDTYDGEISSGLKVEVLLANIRVIAMKRSREIARELRCTESKLYQKANDLENLIATSPNEQIVDEYNVLKEQINEIKLKRGQSAIIRSQATWLEDGEKPSKYFFRVAKQRASEKCITALQKRDGSMVYGDRDILRECAEHYKQLYSSDDAIQSNLFQEFSLTENDPRLTEEEKLSCEGPISVDECRYALARMARNKTAGISGFSAEFYSFFWNDMGSMIVEYINYAKQTGELFVTHRRGLLTLIPKKGCQMSLTNKRPICLLDVLYKLIAKVIANRLLSVAGKLVNNDQTGFMKGRYIGENIRLISDTIEYCKIDKKEGVLLALDYRNAFDSVDHSFMWYTLESFNFGVDIISWIKLLYHNNLLAVTNRGYTSKWFPCTRGTFQGSPLSGLLFNLVAEMLANKIRSAQEICGININNIEVKVSQYCDDTTLFLNDSESVEKALQLLEKFKQTSGLGINISKTKIMWLGPACHKRNWIDNIEAVSKIKILGITFSASEDCGEDNIAPVCKKIKSVINSWSQRCLTIKGRITVAKSLLTSQLVYLSLNAKIPNEKYTKIPMVDLKNIHSHIMKYLWRGRPPKVAFATIRQHIKDGGLKAPDVEEMFNALRATWIRRIYINIGSRWRQLLQSRFEPFGIRNVLKNGNCKSLVMAARIPVFYKEVILNYQKVFPQVVDNAIAARNQILWYNDDIKINGRPIFIKQMYDAPILMIDDLLGNCGKFMNFTEIKGKFPQLRINFLKYQGVLNAIPRTWKAQIRAEPHVKLSMEDKKCCFFYPIRGKRICIRHLRSYHVYDKQITKKRPTAEQKWIAEGFDITCWKDIYELPYKVSPSTKLQSLQFRVLNRYIPTRKFLCNRNVIGSMLCRRCFQIDNLQHFLYYCEDVRPLWDYILCKLKESFSLPAEFLKIETVLFGFVKAPAVVNLIALLCKQYIVNCKVNENPRVPNVEQCIRSIVMYYRAEKLMAKKQNRMDKFLAKWDKIVDSEDNSTLWENITCRSA